MPVPPHLRLPAARTILRLDAQGVVALRAVRAKGASVADQARRQSLEGSERILDAVKQTPELDGGPYRAIAPPSPPESAG